jgi:hypothetical protein
MAIKFSGLGAENKRNVYIASALGVVLLGVAIYTFHDSFSSPPAPAPPPPVAVRAPARPATSSASATSSTSSNAPREAKKVAGGPVNLDPTLHPELMAQAESLEYAGNGRNIFSLTSVPVDIPAPVKPARNIEQVSIPTGPPPPAPPPPIDLKFFGFAARQSGTRRAFLLKGDDVFIASEGDVVDHRYKVVKIAANSVQVEDIPYANTQSLPLVQN